MDMAPLAVSPSKATAQNIPCDLLRTDLEPAVSKFGLGSQRWFRNVGTSRGGLRSSALFEASALLFHLRVIGRYVHDSGPADAFEVRAICKMSGRTYMISISAFSFPIPNLIPDAESY